MYPKPVKIGFSLPGHIVKSQLMDVMLGKNLTQKCLYKTGIKRGWGWGRERVAVS